MDREPDDFPFSGEVLPPSFVQGAAQFHAHEAYDELVRTYGREQADRLWREIPEEHRS